MRLLGIVGSENLFPMTSLAMTPSFFALSMICIFGNVGVSLRAMGLISIRQIAAKYILSACDDFYMRRIRAGFISAKVIAHEFFWYLPEKMLISPAMSMDCATSATASSKLPITLVIFTGNPLPAWSQVWASFRNWSGHDDLRHESNDWHLHEWMVS